MMKSNKWVVTCVLGLMLASSPAVLADDSPDLSIGGGVTGQGTDSIQALIRVDFTYARTGQSGVRYIIANLRSDAGIDVLHMNFDDLLSNASFLDVDFDALGIEYHPGNFWVGADLLGVNVQRNLAVSNDLIARASFAGFRSGVNVPLNNQTRLIVQGALDLLGYAMVRDSSDDSSFNGIGHGANIEAGVEFADRYRVMLGHSVDGATGSMNQTTSSNWQCYTGSGEACRDYSTSQTYLDVMAGLTEHLSAFGRVSYSVYRVNEGATELQRQSALQFRLGVAYNF